MTVPESASAFEQVTRVEVENLKERVERMEDILVHLQNRLPTWALFLFSALSLFLGACLSAYFK